MILYNRLRLDYTLKVLKSLLFCSKKAKNEKNQEIFLQIVIAIAKKLCYNYFINE